MICEVQVKKYCKNFTGIENYNKAIADTQIWDCHHRLETHNSDGERRLVDLSRKELITLEMYYDRPPEELIFLTHSAHTGLHKEGNKYFKGKHISEEQKRRLSEVNKGRIAWNKGKPGTFVGKHHSEETRGRISETLKGHSVSEESRKKMSELMKGRHWFNNGIISVLTFECPEGFVSGRLDKEDK